MRPVIAFQALLCAAAALSLTACPAKDSTTTYIYQTAAAPSAFPGTPASASNLAEDAKALSPGGQDVVSVKVFFDGHDSQRAVVLLETRAFLAENSYTSTDAGPPATTTTYTSKNYFRHLWASYFDGAALSKPVELVGTAMAMVGTRTDFVTVRQDTLEVTAEGVATPWTDVIDSAAVAFVRPTTTGGFGAGASSAAFTARDKDAVILFKNRDVDTNPGINPAGGQADNSNTRLYYSYFDWSQRAVERAETAGVVGTAREFRFGFMTTALAVNSEVSFNSWGSSINNVGTFGVLSDGFVGQHWWGYTKDERDNKLYANEGDKDMTFSNFFVALWTEMVSGYVTSASRGVWDRITNNATPGNEIDTKMMAAVFDLETGLFSTPQEIHLDTAAVENDTSLPSWVRSEGDSFVADRFITYDNQVFFTFVEAAVDNDPASVGVNTNWDQHGQLEGLDSAVAWNRFTPTAGTTSGSGSFLTNSLRLSPPSKAAHIGVTLGAASGQDMPDILWELVGEFDNENGRVVFGADEGLEVTYVFFTHQKIAMNPPFAYTLMADDTDLYAAQVRHNEATACFVPAEDLLEVDTLGDTISTDNVTVVAENSSAMTFSTGAPADRLEIGTTNNGPVMDDWPAALLTVDGETRLVIRNPSAPSGAGGLAYLTTNGSGTWYDENFPASATDAAATVESLYRGVQKDWKVVLNKSSEWFLLLYRQQDSTNQSFENFSGVMRYHTPDVGLYAGRLNTLRDGEAVVALSGKALRGSSAVRLDSDSPTTNPTSANHFREDAVGFVPQIELDHPFAIQSDLTVINVLFAKVEDTNPAYDDARNTTSGNQSHEMLRASAIQNGASTLTANPPGGRLLAAYPVNYFTEDNAATKFRSDKKLSETAAAADAGVGGHAILYYKRPTATEVQDGTGTFVMPTPASERVFASNFSGTLDGTAQISTAGSAGQNQVLAFLTPVTRGLSAAAASGKYHMVLMVEDPNWAAGGFVGGGALVSVRYNKAVPEAGATSAISVTSSDAFTPLLGGTGTGPLRADFSAGDSVSFPVGYGMDQGDLALYFIQFGEVYYTEYDEATGAWWTDSYDLPAPTLLSNEGFPGMTNAFIQLVFRKDSDLFLANSFGTYYLETFQGTIGTTTLTCTRYDSRDKALMFYCKDDGGWDPEDDGTGFNRLFCRIRN